MSGLDDVIAAETRLSEVDGAHGRLVICGHELGDLAGRFPYEGVLALLLPDLLSSNAEAIRALHEDGMRIIMLTGDSRATAEAVARQLGLDEVVAEVLPQEKAAVERGDASARVELLGDFHVRMAELSGNEVLAQILRDLVSRSSLITLMYQRAGAAAHSQEEHVELVKAIAARDEERAVRLMEEHLRHVEENLALDRPVPTHDIAQALA